MGKLFSRVLVSGLALLIFGPLQGWAQTDVAVSAFGAFNQSTSGAGTVQSPSNQAGFLIEARRIRNPLVGYEVTYAYNRANQAYSSATLSYPPCPPPIVGAPPCGPTTTTKTTAISANAHEFTADWVASLKVANLRPFALAGGGVLVNVPSSGTSTTVTCNMIKPHFCVPYPIGTPTSTATEAVFVYGAGLDWTLLPHVGLRFQYRGNVYKAPDLTTALSSTDSFTQTAEPMVGAFFRF
ncbi:MAG: outer membrane beta-barrel protein [Acidobacteriaceae bacterium]